MKISPTQKQHVRTEINERKDWPHLCLSYRPLFCISQEKKTTTKFSHQSTLAQKPIVHELTTEDQISEHDEQNESCQG
jgi:hypothetical protein